MLVTRTPLRLPLGGGGSDLPAYFSRYTGYLLGAAIDKYVYIVLNRRFERSLRISYSKTEIVESVDDIEHPIVREALRLVEIQDSLEIVSVADLPSNSGLGSSSSFTVGLLNALHAYKGEYLSPKQLAEEAYTVEVEILKEPIGKQDQYLAAFGGVRSLAIDRQGAVIVEPVAIPDHTLEEFETSILLFYTGVKRRASDVLTAQSNSIARDEGLALNAMHTIVGIGREVQQALESGDLDRFGGLLHRHWETKRMLATSVSSDQIDHWYGIARANGALGGKIMGAGGGGFFMFCVPNGRKPELRRALHAVGLREMRYSIESTGSKVVVNV